MKQLDLRLRYSGWGGRRQGAGRKAGATSRIAHARRETFSADQPCLVTVKVRRGYSSLRVAALVAELERSFRRGCQRPGFRLNHYSIQADHLHLIVEATGSEALGRGMMAIGARLARAVNRVFERSGPVLRERYHVRALRTPTEVRAALRYVLLNHRKHARAPELRERIDPASSGRWFDGWTEKAEALDPAAVARPESWLLCEGWRRHGTIDPGEVPGVARA